MSHCIDYTSALHIVNHDWTRWVKHTNNRYPAVVAITWECRAYGTAMAGYKFDEARDRQTTGNDKNDVVNLVLTSTLVGINLLG